PFAATLFFDVSGGPLGIEPLIGASGPGMALLLVLLVPFLYAIPSALMTAELSSAMPHNGGYYVWVKAAFGEGAAFICSFWTLIYCVIDA
ncbi:amino acid permease, partial [Acinetobacter baumannii]